MIASIGVRRAGRPRIDRGLRELIQRISRENPLWGASRIDGELLKLGFEASAHWLRCSGYSRARPGSPLLNPYEIQLKSARRCGNYVFSDPGAMRDYCYFKSDHFKEGGSDELRQNSDKLTYTRDRYK